MLSRDQKQRFSTKMCFVKKSVFFLNLSRSSRARAGPIWDHMDPKNLGVLLTIRCLFECGQSGAVATTSQATTSTIGTRLHRMDLACLQKLGHQGSTGPQGSTRVHRSTRNPRKTCISMDLWVIFLIFVVFV